MKILLEAMQGPDTDVTQARVESAARMVRQHVAMHAHIYTQLRWTKLLAAYPQLRELKQ